MKQNKLILFDWGGIVESHFDGYGTDKAFNDMFKSVGYKEDISIFGILPNYNIMTIDTYEEFGKIYDDLKEKLHLTADYETFLKIHKEIGDKIYYYKDVVEYEHSLKDKCYIGILSNIPVIEKSRMNKQVDLSYYDYTFLSYEIGLKKPDIKLYEYIMNQTGFDAKDILFIDDQQVNLEAAASLGWNTFLGNGKELDSIKKACEKFLNDN